MIDSTATPDATGKTRLTELLDTCVRLGASDLHLSTGLRPILRRHGELEPLADQPPIEEREMHRIADELLAGHIADWAKGSVDGACTGPAASRFRFNVFRRGGQFAVALRRLEDRFRSLAELGLPDALYSLSGLRDGLVIVSGPAGAGKSTTLATLIDRINQTRACHVVTIEDPVEYVHTSAKSLMHQRQIGLDAPTFNDALVASLRQDPDVILVGEIRDLPTIRTAIVAAQTGHLVFTTLHAGDGPQAVERLVSVFSEEEQEAVRRQLAIVLRAVIAQHLLPVIDGADGPSRTAVSEVLMVTPAVANLIASGRSAQIHSAIEVGGNAGMHTLEQDLARLWVSGRITEAAAIALARDVQAVRDRAAQLRRTAGVAHRTPGARPT